jgi:uncharacterized protein YggE
MYDPQPIQSPFGVSVFGSALIRVAPDVASLEFADSRIEKMPKAAFSSARRATSEVRKFLQNAKINDVGSSRVKLTQVHTHSGGEPQFVGYKAKVGFHVVLDDLDRVEEVLIAVVDSGANEIDSISFETRELKTYRAQARQKAVEAAREKAEIYCSAADVQLGSVLHIEDVNPDILTGRRESHARSRIEADDPGEMRAFDPGAITIGGAVRVAFSIKADQT